MADKSDSTDLLGADGQVVKVAHNMLSPEFMARHRRLMPTETWGNSDLPERIQAVYDQTGSIPADLQTPPPLQSSSAPGLMDRAKETARVALLNSTPFGVAANAVDSLAAMRDPAAVAAERSKQDAVGGVTDDLSHGQIGHALGRVLTPNLQAAAAVNGDRYNSHQAFQAGKAEDALAANGDSLRQQQQAQTAPAQAQVASPVARAFRPAKDRGLDDAYAMQQDAARQAAETGAAKANEEYGYQREAMQRQADLSIERQKMMSAYQQHRQNGLDKLQQMNAEFSQQQVDPNRFWASRDNGQKVMAAIATALGGFSGNSNPMQIIQGAIKDDIEAQKANIDIKGQVGKNQQNILGLMRENFGDDVTAQNAAEAALLAQTQAKISSLTSKYGGADAKANGQNLIAQLQQQLQEKHQAAAQNIEKNAQEWAKISVEREKASAALLNSKALAGPKPLDTATTERVAKLNNAIKAVDDMRKSYDTTGKMGVISKYLPGTDAGKFESSRSPLSVVIGEALKGSTLRGQEHDIYEKMLPSAGTPSDAAHAKLGLLGRQLRDQRAALLDALQKGGHGTGEFGNDQPSAASQAFKADDGESD